MEEIRVIDGRKVIEYEGKLLDYEKLLEALVVIGAEEKEQRFDERTIRELQRIRRANNGILGCAQLLNLHGANDGSIPARKVAWIRLTPQQASGMPFAIEACADMIDELFESYFEDHGVGWDEEHLPEIRREAEASDAYLNREMTFEEFKEDRGIDRSIQ